MEEKGFGDEGGEAKSRGGNRPGQVRL